MTPAELGAEFIHGRAPQTTALIRDAGLVVVDTGGESWTFDRGALAREATEFASAAALFEGALSLPRDRSVDDFLRQFEIAGETAQRALAARAFVEGFDAADPAIASVRAIAQEWRAGADATSARPVGGYGSLLDYMRAALTAKGVRISLGTVVRRISWRRGSVVIEATASGTDAQTISARAALITLPAGVLRGTGSAAVTFDPDLPAEKREALQRIEMGHVVKVVLSFKTAFWERLGGGRFRDAGFFHSAAAPIPTYWTLVPLRSELVSAWAGGPKAIALAALPPHERIERALTGFAALFGAHEIARAEFERALTHDWSADPFSRGAYSYAAVGGENSRGMLARPVERTLFFAGEATSTTGQGGTVNGALETGARAAAELLDG